MTTGELQNQSYDQQSGGRITLRHVQLLLVVVGIIVSGYLSYVKFTDEPMVCVAGGPFNCNVVQNSIYADFLGIPIAYFGLALYLVLGTLLIFENRADLLQTDGRLIVFGLSLFGWIYSMYLVYIQFFVLEALCPWCLTHEANFTIFFGIAIFRLAKELRSEQA